jgi:hypothetical protein
MALREKRRVQSLQLRARGVGMDDIAAANLIGRLHRTESGYLMRWNQATPFCDWNKTRTLQGTRQCADLRHQIEDRCLIYQKLPVS